ncbi:hypothetical protein [Azospirillum cavernae]|nr:hypothetical protein [Azospirillum cavernae]
MPPTQDVFGMAVLLLGLSALGLSVIFEASRLSAAAGRLALIRRRAQSRQREKLELKIRLDSGETEAAAKQVKLDAMMAERSRIIAATAALKLSKIEMVHEIGEPDSGMTLFQADLRTIPEQGRADQRRIVFAKEIWERNNIAHVWAETPESAMAAIQRAFTTRSGIVASRLQRAVQPKIAGPTSDSTVAASAPPATTPTTPVLRAPATASIAAAAAVQAA